MSLGSRSTSYSAHVRPSTPGAASRLSVKNASRSRSTLRWWKSAVNFSFFLGFACRTRSSACDTFTRPWVRHVLRSPAFLSVPSLHQLRRRSPGFVRRLHSYYDRVRLLTVVHHRLRLLTFPIRTKLAKEPTWPTMRSPSSRTRSVDTCQGLRPRRAVQALAMTRPSVLPSANRKASAPENMPISWLNGWPMSCHPLPTLRRHPRG